MEKQAQMIRFLRFNNRGRDGKLRLGKKKFRLANGSSIGALRPSSLDDMT